MLRDRERAVGPEADAGNLLADQLPELARARSARCSSGPGARPLTQTRPKLRTDALRASRSASSWATWWPALLGRARVHRAEHTTTDHHHRIAIVRLSVTQATPATQRPATNDQ